MSAAVPHLQEPVVRYARTDFPLLRCDMSIQNALDAIRTQGVGEKIVPAPPPTLFGTFIRSPAGGRGDDLRSDIRFQGCALR